MGISIVVIHAPRDARSVMTTISIQFDGFFPVLVELLKLHFGFFERLSYIFDLFPLSVEIGASQLFLQRAQFGFTSRNILFEILDFSVRKTSLALRCCSRAIL